jgi:hypothetical protein
MAGGKLNLNLLRDAMNGPGADPRAQRWAGYVVVDGDPSVEADGVYVTAILQPDGAEVSVRLSPIWATAGAAAYKPVHEGDLLVVVFPTGSPSGGAVEVAAQFASDTDPSADSQLLQDDIWLVVPEGRDLRLRVTGGGAVEIKASLIVLETTGDAATSRVVIDGVPWSGVQLQTPTGPTVGPPVPGPTGAAALVDIAAWQSRRAGGQ